MGDEIAAAKLRLRNEVLSRRRARPVEELQAAAEALADHVLALPELAGAATVAAYVSQQGEPGTGPLLARLLARGTTVLLPVLLDDFDLDWAPYDGGRLVSARFGIVVPVTQPLGPEAIADARVVICPGVAVDGHGRRLGRGGGSYDRALARRRLETLTVQLAYDDEVVEHVPNDAHDVVVDVIVTPTGLTRVPAAKG